MLTREIAPGCQRNASKYVGGGPRLSATAGGERRKGLSGAPTATSGLLGRGLPRVSARAHARVVHSVVRARGRIVRAVPVFLAVSFGLLVARPRILVVFFRCRSGPVVVVGGIGLHRRAPEGYGGQGDDDHQTSIDRPGVHAFRLVMHERSFGVSAPCAKCRTIRRPCATAPPPLA